VRALRTIRSTNNMDTSGRHIVDSMTPPTHVVNSDSSESSKKRRKSLELASGPDVEDTARPSQRLCLMQDSHEHSHPIISLVERVKGPHSPTVMEG
jgi:hypothetical protein